jgi:rhamnogalacturonan hydrolase
MDGIIYRTGTAGGTMLVIQDTSDFEFFSLNSHGAIQGYGYEFLSQGVYGPRLVRLISVVNFSIHDIILVDSPAYHLTVYTCTNGEVYNMIIRGANQGGLDGIDSSGTNLWYHDIEVTNKDECVTIKNPSTYTLVEYIYCNWSGGCAMGSLGSDTAISNIEYNYVYTWQSNQMYMIKTNGGSGTVSQCSFNNFIGHENAYVLDINEYWTDAALAPGDGVVLTDITFTNWQGDIVEYERASIQVLCADLAPCTDLTLTNILMWTDTDTAMHYLCESAYGTGYCLRSGSGSGVTSYTSTTTVSTAPSGWNGPTMPNEIQTGLGVSVSIAIPTIPTTFFPGATPLTPLLNGSGAGAGASATASTSTTKVTTTSTTTSTGSSGSCAALYGQCGGIGWTGSTCCASGSTCKLKSH